LDTVREAVRTEVQRKKRFERARQQAENALKMLTENGFDWQAAAKKFQREIKQAEVPRTGDFVPGLGRNPELKQAAFKLENGQTADRVFATDTSSVMVRAGLTLLPPESAFEEEKEQLRQQLITAKQQEAFNRYIQQLKAQYSVDIDRELFEAL
jgi:peptidyl-prolyl cis-trans isomerase C